MSEERLRAIRIEPLAEQHFEGFARLMETSGTGCYCRYWHFAGDKNAWLAKMAFTPEENRDEQRRALSENDGTARGLVAIVDDEIIGWLKIAPRRTLDKLVRLGPYRRAEIPSGDVHGIACLFVREDFRRRGVGADLVRAAADYSRSIGADFVEAFPRKLDTAVADEQLMLGVSTMFDRAGFVREGGEDSFPLLRKALK